MSFSIQSRAAFAAVPSFGKATLFKIEAALRLHHLTPEEVWKKKTKLQSLVSLTEEQINSWETFCSTWTIRQYWQHLVDRQIKVLTPSMYPKLLRQIPDFPFILFCMGDLKCLDGCLIAVVGSRKPTRYGQWATQKIVVELTQLGASVVSGFMIGVDYQSHQTTLRAGGKSVGVLGYGFGQIFPRHLEKAAQEFLEAGNLFVTEYPPDKIPHPGQFPARNRIVAGLSTATIVVEAQQRSGSLITAQFALDYNRVVGAVPGPIDSMNSVGTHDLLKQGAVVVTSGEDIWREVNS